MAENKVLVIEDDPMSMRLAQSVLRSGGYVTLGATTAEAGIEVARRELPDAVLMDIGLPGMDGLEASRVLKESSETKGIPIIALTAHALPGDREKCLGAGCDGYLTKPYDLEVLLATLKHFIALSRGNK